MRVDHGRHETAMPGEALREADVLGLGVDALAGRVPQHMKRDPPLESGPVLPHGEAVADLSERQTPPEAADEEGGVIVEALALAGLPLVESAQLSPERLREQDLLGAAGPLCSFEDTEQQAPSRPTVPKHIP